MDSLSAAGYLDSSSNAGTKGLKKKAPRKSRSTGLRTKTGCITCRKRHKKCNEVRPSCGNCSSSNRKCVWPNLEPQSYSNPSTISQDSGASQGSSRDRINPNFASPLEQSSAIYLACDGSSQPHLQIQSPDLSYISPSNTVSSEFLTADLASVRWLDLLAGDAEQANRGFTRPSSPALEQSDNLGFEARARIRANNDRNFSGTSKELTASEGHSWQLDKDIVLENHEVSIFRNFVEHSALWLDLFDPHKHFSVYTTRLALRKIGLMKAILALSAQHLSRQASTGSDPNLAIQYYYETLHYVQIALQNNSYTHSEELLAIALIISTYEMLDESESGWQRHLKGVFWIQRSQDVDGGSGGIRQSVWWAWLRQDVWAAFRERRRCLSFWKPVKDYDELSQPELIDRATYLFSQAVNYCADPTSASEEGSVQQRNEAADKLLATLDRWTTFLGDAFKPLPVAVTSSGFQPIWIHPPQLGVALQLFYPSRILIILHRPLLSGFNSYLEVQKSLSEAVAVICGIAMQLTDEGCQIISSQCLYGGKFLFWDSREDFDDNIYSWTLRLGNVAAK